MLALRAPPVIDPEAFDQHADLPGFWLRRSRAGDLAYSDGDDFEDRMLAHVLGLRGHDDADLACEALIRDWPSQYHCDPTRRNLLRPLEALIHGHVLEVGAGCGALSGFLAGLADDLVAVEGAPRRANITAARHRTRSNMVVLGCELAQFQPNRRFDAIVVVGVLEYAAVFGKGALAAPLAFLDRLRAMLAPDGALILAIENQLGLSYLGGMPEDHTGQPWSGVEDRYAPAGVRTFGRRALARLLSNAGLQGQSWYYPFPDYKLPDLVLAEAAITTPELDAANLVAQIVPDRRFRPAAPGFAPALAWQVAGHNDLLPDLADSFLVTASTDKAPPNGGGLAWMFATRRRPKFRKAGRIGLRNGHLIVERWALQPGTPDLGEPVRQVLDNEPFYPGVPYMDEFRRLCAVGVPNTAAIVAWAQDWVLYLKANVNWAGVLPDYFLDCVPTNLLRAHDGTLCFFDREWHAQEPPSLGYVVYRGLLDAFLRMAQVLPPGSQGPPLPTAIGEVMAAFGLDLDLAAWRANEAQLQAAVMGADPAQTSTTLQSGFFRGPPGGNAPADHPDANATLSALGELRQAYTALTASHLRGTFGGGEGPIGYVDTLTTEPAVGRVLRGWAWDRTRSRPADLVTLFVDGQAVAEAPVCLPRPDAAKALGAMTDELGFTVPVPVSCGQVSRDNSTVMASSAGCVGLLTWAVKDG